MTLELLHGIRDYTLTRHNTIDRHDWKCIRCNLNDIEDEFHFVLACPDYINLRNAYIPKYYSNRPSVLKFIELVQTNNTSLLIKLSIYCVKAFAFRNL